MPLLADPSGEGRSEVVSSVRRRAGRLGRSLRSARFRYNEWPDGSRELYDHDVDPGEHTNLASRPEHAATIAELERALGAEARRASREPRRGPPATPARPRNVVLIVVDDLNTRVGAWGAPVKTPAIDRLAARGVRFDRAYAQVAMCSPSRASMLTGWRPERTGVWQNEDPPRPARAVPLQELFAAHGAVTAGIGKIYHSPADFRWDVPEAELDALEEHPDAVETAGPGASGDAAGELWLKAPGGDADQPDGRRARRAVALVERQGARPFFLALGLVRPHRRWIAPARYFGLYPPDSIVVTPAPDDDLADVPAIAVKTQPQPLPGLPLLGREPPGLVRDAAPTPPGDRRLPGLRLVRRRAGGPRARRARAPRPMEGHGRRPGGRQRLPPRRARGAAAQGHALRGSAARPAGGGGARPAASGSGGTGTRGAARRLPDDRRAGRARAAFGPRRPEPRPAPREPRRGRARRRPLLAARSAAGAGPLAADRALPLHAVAGRQRGALRPARARARVREPRGAPGVVRREGSPPRATRGARGGGPAQRLASRMQCPRSSGSTASPRTTPRAASCATC